MVSVANANIPFPYLVLGAIVLYTGYSFALRLHKDARIRKLGARPPKRPSYFPLGLDTAYNVVGHAMKDTIYEMWVAMYEKHSPGHYTLESGVGERVILTAEPENIKAILATQFKDYGKGEAFRRDWHMFLGNGIFTTDGTLWHNSRQLLRPQFIKDRLSDIEIFEEHAQTLMTKIGHGQEIDTLDLMFRFTLDARPLNWLVPRKRMGFYDSIKTMNDFVERYVEQALALTPKELEDKTKNDEGYTFLHAIAGYTRDRQMLRDQLVSVLLAGRDTTACTLTWIIYHLSMDPAITAKLRQEIIDTVGLQDTPTYEHLKNMKYLQNVINETLRLYPIVPYNVRVALTDTTLPVGGGKDGTQPIGILKGTPIGYSTLVMQRRKDLYPPESSGFPAVDKFVPERWENWHPKSWTYIPFNGGPRICIGQQFALTEMQYTLVRMFQRYERVENRMGGVLPGLHADIVLQPVNEIKVAFH